MGKHYLSLIHITCTLSAFMPLAEIVRNEAFCQGVPTVLPRGMKREWRKLKIEESCCFCIYSLCNIVQFYMDKSSSRILLSNHAWTTRGQPRLFLLIHCIYGCYERQSQPDNLLCNICFNAFLPFVSCFFKTRISINYPRIFINNYYF